MHSIYPSSLLSISGYQDKILQHLAERLVKRSHLIAVLGNPNVIVFRIHLCPKLLASLRPGGVARTRTIGLGVGAGDCQAL